MCIVSSQELCDKVNAIKELVPGFQDLYSFEKTNSARHWEELLEAENTELDAELEKRKSAIGNKDLVTLIYTSGTTGNPKGVMLCHDNLLSNVKACEPRLPVNSTGKSLSFLPV